MIVPPQVVLHGLQGLSSDLRPLVKLARALGVLNIFLKLRIHTNETLAAGEAQLEVLHHLIQVREKELTESWLILVLNRGPLSLPIC